MDIFMKIDDLLFVALYWFVDLVAGFVKFNMRIFAQMLTWIVPVGLVLEMLQSGDPVFYIVFPAILFGFMMSTSTKPFVARDSAFGMGRRLLVIMITLANMIGMYRMVYPLEFLFFSICYVVWVYATTSGDDAGRTKRVFDFNITIFNRLPAMA
jgi:hypothetical protein